MAHLHDVIDNDPHFKIDAETREITRVSDKELTLIQGDHNSERCTFEVSKKVDGHDLTLCDLVRVHFINISAENNATTSPGIYEVKDLDESSEDPDTLLFTWLVPKEATTYVGTVNFLVEFICTTDGGVDEEGKPIKVIDYAWHTGVYSGGIISEGMDNSEAIIGKYYDVLDQWVALIEQRGKNAANEAISDISVARAETMSAIDSTAKAATATAVSDLNKHAETVKKDLTAYGIQIDAVQEKGQSEDKVMSQKVVTDELNSLDGKIAENATAISNVESTIVSEIENRMIPLVTHVVLDKPADNRYTISKGKKYMINVDGEVSSESYPFDIATSMTAKYDVFDASLGDITSTFNPQHILSTLFDQCGVVNKDEVIYTNNTLMITHFAPRAELYDKNNPSDGNPVDPRCRFYIDATFVFNDVEYKKSVLIYDSDTSHETTRPDVEFTGDTSNDTDLNDIGCYKLTDIEFTIGDTVLYGDQLASVYEQLGNPASFTVNVNGISSITKTATNGLTSTYTILFDDGTTTTYDVKDGVGVSSMSVLDYGDYEDTYRMDFTDGSSKTFKVPNNNAVGIRTSDSGPIIHAEDLIPLEHTVKAKVRSKNLWSYKPNTVVNGVTISTNERGEITFNGLCTDSFVIHEIISLAPGTYTLTDSLVGDSPTSADARTQIYIPTLGIDARLFHDSPSNGAVRFTLTEASNDVRLRIKGAVGFTYDGYVISPQLERGDTATPYTPYVDPLETILTRCGKNILPPPIMEAGKTKSGVKLIDNQDGTITLNGTSTADLAFILYQGSMRLKGTYTISGLTGGSGETYYIQPHIDGVGKPGLIEGSKTYDDLDGVLTMIKLTIAKDVTFDNLRIPLMLEPGPEATEFEPYNGTDYSLYSDGTPVVRVTSLSPTMNLLADKAGAIIDATYNVDQEVAVIEAVKNEVEQQLSNAVGGGASSYEYVEMTYLYDAGEDEDGNYWHRVTDEILELESKALWYKIKAQTSCTSDNIEHVLEGLFIPDKNLSTNMNKEVFGTFIPTKYGQYSVHSDYEYQQMPLLPSNLTASIFQGDDCSLFEIKGTYMDLEPHEVDDHSSSSTVTIYTPFERQLPDDFEVGNDPYDGWGYGHFEIWAYVPVPENTASTYSLRREEYTESELAKIARIEARKAERRAQKAEVTSNE